MSNSITVPISTRYYQYDQQGVVFNMWYLAFMEDARNAYLTAIGYSLEDLLEAGHDIQVVGAELSWKAAVRYGAEVAAEVRTERIGNTSFVLEYIIRADTVECLRATSAYVIVDAAISGKCEIPAGLRQALQAQHPAR